MRRPSAWSARWRGATSCCRRCSTRARSIAATCDSGARREGRAARRPARGRAARPVLQGTGAAELVERFGWQRVYQGGLRVYSTIDMRRCSGRRSGGRRSAESARRATRRRSRGATEQARRTGERRPSRCRPRSSRIDPQPAMSARWSAAATSTRATSTARCRRSGSRARRSSRSSTPPRSKPATRRRRVIDHLDEPIATLQGAWTPEDEHSRRRIDELRTGAADVEQSRRRAPAAAGRHSASRAVREEDGRRRCAERSVAGARLRRGDAAVDDRGVRRVRQPRPACRRRS